MSDQLPDDTFAARLREATADVPPSRLDLDAVLASSRRKARRRRTAVSASCVAAVAVAGISVPQVAALLPGDGTSSQAVLSAGAGGEGSASTAPACDPADVEVTWSRGEVRPVVAWAGRTVYDGRSTVTEELVPFDPELSSPSVSGSGIDPRTEEAILRAAAEAEGSGTVAEVTWETFDAHPGEGPGELPDLPDALEGFRSAGDPSPSRPSFEALENPGPGTYLFYSSGERHVVTGTATCGDRRDGFVLTYWALDGSGSIDCAQPVEGMAVFLKRAYCDVALTPDERDAIGLDLRRGAESADTSAREMRIAPADG